MRRLVITANARRQMFKASHHYWEIDVNVMMRFESELGWIIERATKTPEQGPVIRRKGRKTRRLLFADFPYALLYTSTSDEVIVRALAHQKQHPEIWRS